MRWDLESKSENTFENCAVLHHHRNALFFVWQSQSSSHIHTEKKTAISLIMSVIQAFRFDFLKLFFSLLNQLSSRWIFFFLNFNGSDVFVFFSFISYSRSFCPFTSQIGNKLRKINKQKNHSHAKIECNRSAERKRIKWHKNEMSRIKCFFF